MLTPVRAQWLRGRASDSRLKGPGFESCAAVLKPWASFFTLDCSKFTLLYEYLAIDSGGYVYEQSSRIVAYGWMLPREVKTVFNRTDLTGNTGEVKCQALSSFEDRILR